MFDSKSSRSEDFINHDEIIKVLEYGRDHKNDSEMVDNILKKQKLFQDLIDMKYQYCFTHVRTRTIVS